MVCGPCEDEWLKFDLAIPYPIPQPFDFSSVPQRVKMFCRRPPDVTPPPPDSMEIERYPTPPVQERRRTQSSQKTLQTENDQPLFYPEDDRASHSSDYHSTPTLAPKSCPRFKQLNQRLKTWTRTKKVRPVVLFRFIMCNASVATNTRNLLRSDHSL